MIIGFVAKVVLSPVIIVQAIRVISSALRLPEAEGPRNGICGNGPPLRLLIIGDSSAAGVGVACQDQALAGQLTAALALHYRVTWQLMAQTGATTRSTLLALEQATLEPADIIVTALGVNDITRSVPLWKWRRQQSKLRATLRQRTGAHHIYISGMPPLGDFPLLPNPLRWMLGRNAKRADRMLLTDLAQDPDTTCLPMPVTLSPQDMAADGFHPGPAIYAEWAKEIASRIISDWPDIKSSSV